MSSSASALACHTVVDDAWLTAQGCCFSGRLTRARRAPGSESSRVSALRRTARMLLTAGLRGDVTWTIGPHHWKASADHRGYWECHHEGAIALYPGWHDITVAPCSSSPASLFVPDPRNRFGIISDLDDTVLITDVLSKRSLLTNSLTLPAEKRACVHGMPELYARLLKQNPAPESSPVFYISSSPRQLTDNLRRFLAVNRFPRGVLQLRRIESKRHEPQRDHTAYKTERIEAVLRAYPEVRFALFGDDGETDPEVYAAMRAKYPSQIAGVFIRRVHRSPERKRYPDQQDCDALLDSV